MKVLVTYASAGIGHKKAAEAVYRAFQLKFSSYEVYIVDALDYSNIIFRWLYPRVYLFVISRLNGVWRFLYYLTDSQYFDFLCTRFREIFHRLNGFRLGRFLEDLKPDVVISTHFFPSEVIASFKKRKRFGGRLITIITDFLPHSFWLLKGSDYFVVALDETKRDLVRRGIVEQKIKVFGIPIDPIFSETKDRKEVLEKLGIRENLFNILIVSGGFGVGRIKDLVLNLNKLKEYFDLGIQLLVVCGKNQRLFEDLTSCSADLKIETKIYGFVDNMDEFMQVCDLIITKSGGITISEALSKGLPIIVIDPVPGQETKNTSIILKYGAGVRAGGVLQVCKLIKNLIDSPERLLGMKARANVLARPNAAEDIAKFAVNI